MSGDDLHKFRPLRSGRTHPTTFSVEHDVLEMLDSCVQAEQRYRVLSKVTRSKMVGKAIRQLYDFMVRGVMPK